MISLQEYKEKYPQVIAIIDPITDTPFPRYYLCEGTMASMNNNYYIPPSLMFKMVHNQILQGNSPCYDVFIQNAYSDRNGGGFDFSGPPEGANWYNFIADYRDII